MQCTASFCHRCPMMNRTSIALWAASNPPGPKMSIPNPLSAPPQAPTLASRTITLIRDVRDLASDHLELVALEAQRAGLGLIKMVIAAVVISILVVSAWLAIVAGCIVWTTAAGVSWPSALAVAAMGNLLLAGLCWLWVRGQAAEMPFAATLRQLRRTADDVHAEVA